MRHERLISKGDETLASRLKWLLFFRLLIAILAIAAIIALEGRFVIIPNTYLFSYYVLTGACFLNLIYLFLMRSNIDLVIQAKWQITIDVLIVSFLVYLTGIDKMFPYLYFAVVLAAAIMISARAAYFSASLAVVTLSAVSLLYFFANYNPTFVLPLVPGEMTATYLVKLNFLLPYVFFFSLSLYVVAFLAAKLSSEVNRMTIFSDEILLNMEGGVIVINNNQKVAFMNLQAVRLLRMDEHPPIVGRDYMQALPPSLCHMIPPDALFNHPIHTELELTERTIEIKTSILPDERGDVGNAFARAGEAKGVIVILNDITLVQQIEEARRDAERFKLLAGLGAGLAHEIRNPLASIRGAAQELRSAAPENDDDRKLFDIVIKESDRLDRIVGSFLDYARTSPEEHLQCNVSDILHDVINLLTARKTDKQFSVDTSIGDRILCAGSPEKLKQVFLNIGLNAVDALASGGRIAFRCYLGEGAVKGKGNAHVVVEIEDNGVGIPSDHRERIFDPFYTTKPRGVGMGLAIARNIVLSYGGDIVLTSAEGRGTVCRILLPLPHAKHSMFGDNR